jgi:hypothetical protein
MPNQKKKISPYINPKRILAQKFLIHKANKVYYLLIISIMSLPQIVTNIIYNFISSNQIWPRWINTPNSTYTFLSKALSNSK